MGIAATLIALAILTPESRAPTPPPDDPLLKYYPPAAFAQQVSGEAVIDCERTEHGGFANCHVVSETPAGEGFGAAALAMAAHAAECQSLSLSPAQRRGHSIMVRFRTGPTQTIIVPDVVSAGWSATYVVHAPAPADFAPFYPTAAKAARIGGHTLMICSANRQGEIRACEVEEETPKGQGFGYAAGWIAQLFKVATLPPNQCPYVPLHVVIPIDWRAD